MFLLQSAGRKWQWSSHDWGSVILFAVCIAHTVTPTVSGGQFFPISLHPGGFFGLVLPCVIVCEHLTLHSFAERDPCGATNRLLFPTILNSIFVKLKYSTHNQVCNFLLSTCNNWPFLTLKLKLHGVILVSHPELRDPFELSMSRIDGTSVDPKFLSIDSQIHFLESSYERLPLWIHYQIWKMPLAYQSSAGLVHLNRTCFMIHPG